MEQKYTVLLKIQNIFQLITVVQLDGVRAEAHPAVAARRVQTNLVAEVNQAASLVVAVVEVAGITTTRTGTTLLG